MSQAPQHAAAAVTAPRSAQLAARSARRIPLLDWALVGLLLLLLIPATPAVVEPAGDSYAPPALLPSWDWRTDWWAWALQLALVVPLLWRRRSPLPVFLVVAAVAFVQWLAGPELYGDVAVLIALYTVTAYEPSNRRLGVAWGVALLGLGLAVERWAMANTAASASTIALTAVVVIPVALGLVTRNRQRLLVATREEAMQAERTRIAREMHDVVTHNLSVMVALADGAKFSLDRDPGAASAALDHIRRTGREGLTEMRRLLGVLADPDDDAPLRPMPGLDDLVMLAETVRAAGLAVDLEIAPDVTPLPSGVGLAVHRIAQEALTNVLKHAPNATQVVVRVARADGRVTVSVENDGGPAPFGTSTPAIGGAGVNGMVDRAGLHGGTLESGPVPTGWRVVASLPVDGAEDA